MIPLVKPRIISIVGSTGVGKSYLAKNLIRNEFINPMNEDDEPIDYLVIFCPTLDLQDSYAEFRDTDKLKVFKISEDIERYMIELFDNQKRVIDQCEYQCEIPNILMVIDDCASNNVMRFRGFLDKISISMRHFNISAIIISQRISGIGRTIRLNSAYFIIFSCFHYQEIESWLEQYLPKKYKKKILERLEEIFEEKYNFIMTDNLNPNIKKRLWLNGTNLIEIDKL